MTSHPFDYGLLKIRGPDAKTFLQGQLTCEINDVSLTASRLAAHCNPQGRVISLFKLFQYEDAYYLVMAREMIPITLTTLKKYAVFFKAELSDVSESLADFSFINTIQHEVDFHQGIPTIYPKTSGMFLPHDINLHELNAIHFQKGCYTGQEIIARMHYKAKRKNHMYPAHIHCDSVISPGDDIYCMQHQRKQIAGTIVDVLPKTNLEHEVLLITDEMNAKEHHLFLDSNHQSFFSLKLRREKN